MRVKGKRSDNRIYVWLLGLLAALTILSAAGIRSAFPTALALEQAPRCGLEEHVHTDECYVDDLLLCEKKMHTHTENCYLVLLEDNDINNLLIQLDATPSKSLETLISSTVVQATVMSQHTQTNMNYGNSAAPAPSASPFTGPYASAVLAPDADPSAAPAPSLLPTASPSLIPSLLPSVSPSLSPTLNPSVSPSLFPSASPSLTPASSPSGDPGTLAASPDPVTSQEIARLNAAAAANELEGSVVLNEDLAVYSNSGESPTETELLNLLLTANESDPITALAIGDEPSTETRAINFYIELDGIITLIGSDNLIYNNDRWTQSRREYCSYDTAVTAYTKIVRTSLSASNIGSTYHLRYNTNGSTESFRSSATYANSNVYFSNTNEPQYALLTTYSNRVYDPVSFYTVTLDYSALGDDTSNQIQYVESGLDSTLTLSDDYLWYDSAEGGSLVSSEALESIEATTTLYARPKNFKVIYQDASGNPFETISDLTPGSSHTVKKPSAFHLSDTSYAWVLNGDVNLDYYGDETVSVTEDLIFRLTPIYTVTYDYPDQEDVSDRILSGRVITLPELSGDAKLWQDLSAAAYYAPGSQLTVDRSYTFQAVSAYTVTLVDTSGGILDTIAVAPGGKYTLAAPDGGYVWVDDSGNTYSSETEFTVHSDLTFTQRGYLTVRYNINWSTTSAGNVGITAGSYTVPTVMGGESYSHTLTQGATETICAVSDSEVTVNFPLDIGSSLRPGIATFQGWKIDGTDTVLSSGEVYTYSELSQYAAGGEITLTGQWNYTKNHSVTFFVEYDSKGDSSSNADEWTPVLYVSHYIAADGTSGSNISTGNTTDQDGDGDVDDYDVDARLRTMVDRGYLSSFPTDEYIFNSLKNYTSGLTVDGIAVDAKDLNEHGYRILWTELLWVSADGDYHLDGRLVRKTGYIYVTKTFSGNGEAIAAVKNGGYSITAVSGEDGRSLSLNLNGYDEDTNPGGYIEYVPETGTYVWKIEDVAYGEQWTLTERGYTAAVDGIVVDPYMEYTVSDALGSQSAHGEYTTSVSVTGQTYDDTIATDQVLTVRFSNIYPGTDSFILKKEDTDTGNALAGASFSLYQNGELLKFNYADGVYTCAEDGTLSELDCTSGFLEITVQGLDFAQGLITVVETRTPEGYISLADAVTLTKSGDAVVIDGGNSDTARMSSGVLIIGNTSVTATVTVNKHWANTDDARDVIVNLYANGSLVTTLFPNLTNVSAVVTLNESGGYTYTWTGLPAYADGSLIQWSVAETRIGEERANADGTFANWTVVYSDANTAVDGEGNPHVTLSVTNAKKAGNTLMIYKTSTGGTALSGAQFLLQMLNDSGVVSTDFTAQAGTTDGSGLLTFSGLPYGTYLLTETSAPAGYHKAGVVRFTVNPDQTITILEDGGGMAQTLTGGLVIRVNNQPVRPLPETGGSGTTGYTLGGLLLMAAALFTLYQRSRRKEETPDA